MPINHKFSIIIPVYNAESYLHECLDSILKQTYRDFEVLMINDGSKDSSGNICDEYAAKDSRFHAIHKTNGGVSSARNLGLAKASGEWIVCIDSDDEIECEYLTKIAENIESDIDLIHVGYSTINSDGRGLNGVRYAPLTSIDKSLPSCIPSLLKICAPWGKAFRRSAIEEHHLSFDTKLCVSEDRLFLFQFLLYVSGIKFIDYVGYRYRQLPNSLMTKVHPVDVQLYRLECLYKAAFDIREKWNLSFEQFLPFWLCHLVYVQLVMDMQKQNRQTMYETILSDYFTNYIHEINFVDKIKLIREIGTYRFLLSTYHYNSAQVIRNLYLFQDYIKKSIKNVLRK